MAQSRIEREKAIQAIEDSIMNERAEQRRVKAETKEYSAKLQVLLEARNKAQGDLEAVLGTITIGKHELEALESRIAQKQALLAQDNSFIEVEQARLGELAERIILDGAKTRLYYGEKLKEIESEKAGLERGSFEIKQVLDNLDEQKKSLDILQKMLDKRGNELSAKTDELLFKEKQLAVENQLLKIGKFDVENQEKLLKESEVKVEQRTVMLDKIQAEINQKKQTQEEQDIVIQSRLARVNELIALYKLENKINRNK